MRFWLCLIWGCAFAAAASSTDAQEPASARQRHAWGKFGTGSWKHVRVLSEQLDDAGGIAGNSATETTSTLEKVNDQYFTLQHETTLEVGGKKIGGDPKSVTQGYYGELSGQTATIRKTGDGELTIAGRSLNSSLFEVIVTAGGRVKRTSVIHYNSKVAPYVLKRTTNEPAADGKGATTTTVEVLASEMPYRVLDELCPVTLIRTVEMRPDGTSAVSYEAQCADVPGGTVWQSSKVMNSAGKVVKRSVLELLDYHVDGQGDEDGQELRRRRFHRTRTPMPPSAAPNDKSRRGS